MISPITIPTIAPIPVAINNVLFCGLIKSDAPKPIPLRPVNGPNPSGPVLSLNGILNHLFHLLRKWHLFEINCFSMSSNILSV